MRVVGRQDPDSIVQFPEEDEVRAMRALARLLAYQAARESFVSGDAVSSERTDGGGDANSEL